MRRDADAGRPMLKARRLAVVATRVLGVCVVQGEGAGRGGRDGGDRVAIDQR